MDTAGCYGHPTKCRKSPSDESLEGANRWLRQETVSPRDAEVLVTHGLQVRQLQVTVLWLPQQAGEMGKAGILTSQPWASTTVPHPHTTNTLRLSVRLHPHVRLASEPAASFWAAVREAAVECFLMGTGPIPLTSERRVYPLVKLWTPAADRPAPGHLKGRESRTQAGKMLGF